MCREITKLPPSFPLFYNFFEVTAMLNLFHAETQLERQDYFLRLA
jgi:hypothetical protein